MLYGWPAWRVSTLSIALAAGVIVLASMHARGVPAVELARERHDRWALAYVLGEIDGARDVYAAAPGGIEAHYYTLVARRNEAVRVELRPVPGQGGALPHLRMALIGPGLPRGRARTPGLSREVGLVQSRPANLPGEAPRQVLEARLPQRGRCVLVVLPLDGRGGVYRLRLDGRAYRSPGALLAYPLRLLEVAYLVSPRRTASRLLAAAIGVAWLFALRYLVWRRRVVRGGGFKG